LGDSGQAQILPTMKNFSQETSVKSRTKATGGVATWGMPVNVATGLCYLWLWISGIVFILVEKNNSAVRFHAWQSIVTFGALTIVIFALFFIPPVPYGILYFLAWGVWAFVIALGAYLWVLLLVTSFLGRPYTLPAAGRIASKLDNLFPGATSPTHLPAILKHQTGDGKFCTVCGGKIPEKAIFCPECGEKQLLEAMATIDQLGRVIESERFDDSDRVTTAIRKAMSETVNAVTVIGEKRDPYTAGHQRRVTELARAIAGQMNLPQKQIEGLNVAGQLHDIGKISVPSDILNKPGRLSEGEMIVIQGHPQVSYDILKTIDFPWPVARIAYQHHERMDGSGYPQGLKGDDILLEARILSVADVVEAMASHRPYRPALGIDRALEEIAKNRGTLYDGDVVDACLKLFNENGFKFV
jgi:uncharacterized membrane protein